MFFSAYFYFRMFTFGKQERLTGKTAIEVLYKQGKSKNFFPLRVFVLPVKDARDSPVRFLISVPKKRIRRAVDRNRARRIIREAWRLNKHKLYEALSKKNLQCNVMFLYLSSDLPSLKQIEKKLPAIFDFILAEIGKD